MNEDNTEDDTEADTDIEACMIMRRAGHNDLADAAFEKKPEFDEFLTDHLRMWKDSGVPAPVNEVASIQAWMGTLKHKGAEETLRCMGARLVLLNRAAQELHAAGPEAEAEAGIYDNRPDQRPNTET